MGEQVRITVQLTDGVKGENIWAERYDRKTADIFVVQDEIARTITASTVPEITHAEQEIARRKPPRDLNAWELYQRGLWHLYQFTLDEMREAGRLLERAAELDPEFPAIHSGLGYVLLQWH